MLGTVTEICLIGNPVLRLKAACVADPTSSQILQLSNDMLATMGAASGVGIAAPQIGQLLRVIIVASRPNPRYPDAPAMEPLIMVNPEIICRSDDMVEDVEGCLSVPDLRLPVLRHREIKTGWLDLCGNRHQQSFTGFIARVIQHEIDHLDGILFPDRLVPAGREFGG